MLLTWLARALAAIEGEGEIEPPYRRSEPNGDGGGSCSSWVSRKPGSVRGV